MLNPEAPVLSQTLNQIVLTKHRKTLKQHRYSPYQDFLDKLLEIDLDLDTDQQSTSSSLDSEDSQVDLLSCLPFSPLKIAQSGDHFTWPDSPFSTPPLSPLPFSPLPSPTDSDSTISAEDLFFTPINSATPSTSPSPTPLIDSPLSNPNNSELPPDLISFLCGDHTEEPEFQTSKTRESNIDTAEPSITPEEILLKAAAAPLPILTAAEVEESLSSLPPSQLFQSKTPEDSSFITPAKTNTDSQSLVEQSCSPPNLLNIQANPTKELIEHLKTRKRQTGIFHKNKRRSPKSKLFRNSLV